MRAVGVKITIDNFKKGYFPKLSSDGEDCAEIILARSPVSAKIFWWVTIKKTNRKTDGKSLKF